MALPAAAKTLDSVYTDLDFDRCTEAPGGSDGGPGILKCEGLEGLPVFISESDLRFVVGFGPEPGRQCSFSQTFRDFNAPGRTVEWRLRDRIPFATILRWSLHRGDGKITKSWLVVTRLGPPDTCHTAYVEGSSPEANALARKYADEFARGFDCRKDKPDVSLKIAGGAAEGLPDPCR